MPRNLTLAERANIIAFHDDGLNISEISRHLNVSRQAVRLWIRREGEEGNLNDRHRSGRRPEVSNEQKLIMRQEYENNGFTPTKHFGAMFDVSTQTIRNHLHDMGLHYRHYANKIHMTDDHRDARYNFARERLNFDWSNTVFCDEKTF